MNFDDKEISFASWSRRRFMQMSAATAVAANLGSLAHAEASGSATMIDVPFQKKDPRVVLIGTGGRGTNLLQNLLAADAQMVGLCDLVKEKAEHAASLVVAAGQKKPELYTDGPHDFEKMLSRQDVDLVVIATPWVWHTEMAIFGMKHGKDVALEVPGVTTIEDCWKIVKTSEETRKHCMMLENCCYGYNETLILRMVHAGKFGELLYGEGAYLHDLREELFSTAGEGLWRRAEHLKRDGNIYPTHGLGPVANYMGIQRGDRFGYIVSMSTPQRGLDAYRKEHLKADDPRMAEKYVTGDMNTSMIKTVNGLTITVKHAVANPHPYDRINLIAGTKGVFQDYPPRIYLDGQNSDESWEPIDKWKEYQHPLWKTEGEIAQKLGGHGGMDYIMLYRLLQCVREGLPPDIDVYDTAAWSSVAPLSVASVSHGSAPVEFPDFTRGKWKQRKVSAIATQV
ncbi:Gfo/Idh/MocA family oxidoreductase [Terriglobus saanensis]|uniref:Alpha-N-acetylgalactosaminidase n=1 Tax=Terriglobus saanensis (strain ATCC BAA-1853 / DSM 23119 / SP1PR4) TaxID=401053 RepID=E8V066_TERSS|nr:Gfo/Idh/MocA family oxidoreductase [Terriglobus saanensis]ADV83284.1 Alpha-N-acetylgalactosaminidase [Terriglobus saanensis SP1PR4]